MIRDETEEARNDYSIQRKITKKLLREKKRKYYEDRLIKIEEDYRNGEIRNLYRGVRKERRGYQAKSVLFKGKDGRLLAGENQILNRWQEYFSELLNESEVRAEEECTQIQQRFGELKEEEEEQPPDKEEIQEIITNLRNNKSPGNDGLTAEMFKYGGPGLLIQLQRLIEEIWLREEMPPEWTEPTICPIFKKGEKVSAKAIEEYHS